ncbi:glycoside hydrolase family 3 N-terminal domain-containing protein [Bartonella sp. B17]
MVHLPAEMTAHIVYEAINDKLPARLSERVIENDVTRKKIGFYGFLILDDISIKVLSEECIFKKVFKFNT